MIATARGRDDRRRLRASPTCATGPRAGEPVDVLVSNATLQWVPGHLDLLPAPGRAGSRPAAGSPSRCPATSTSPATRSARELAAEPPYAAHTARRRRARLATTPRRTSTRCAGLGCEVDAWETTYLHVLHRRGPGVHLGQRHRRPADPAGAARRPAAGVRGRSSSGGCARPTRPRPHGVVLPFRRVFVVARTAELGGRRFRGPSAARAGAPGRPRGRPGRAPPPPGASP